MNCFVNQVVQTECKKTRIKSHGRRSATGLRATVRCGENKQTTQKWLRVVFKIKSNNKTKTLQGALEAATFQSGFHLFGVRGAVGAAENHLPPPALGDPTTNTCGCCCLAGSGTVHPGDLTSGRTCSEWLVALQLLPDHLSLTRELWTSNETNVYWFWPIFFFKNSNLHFEQTSFTCVAGGPGISWLTVTDGRPSLRNATFPVPAVLPPAGRRLQPSITILTLVAFAALATVGVSLWHTLTVRTSGGTTRRQDNEAPVELCVLSDYFGETVASY